MSLSFPFGCLFEFCIVHSSANYVDIVYLVFGVFCLCKTHERQWNIFYINFKLCFELNLFNLLGTVNKFNLRCNPGSTFNPLPSTSVLRDDSYVENGPLDCNNTEKHASAMSQDRFVGAPSLDLPPNTQQLDDHVYPADFENSQLNKPIALGDPREIDKLKILSKDVDPNQIDSNENASSSHLDSDDIIGGFNTFFDILYGLTVDEQMAFENNFGVLPNSDSHDSTDDKQMSIQNIVGVLQNGDAEFSADYCLDRLSNLSLEPNSEDTDVTMRDMANHSFSEAVEMSILVSS